MRFYALQTTAVSLRVSIFQINTGQLTKKIHVHNVIVIYLNIRFNSSQNPADKSM